MTTTEEPENFKPTAIVTGVIVEVDEDILLLKRAPYKKVGANKWALCAGKVEEGEQTLHAAQRELQEELGVFVQQEELSFVETYYHYPDSDPTHRIVWTVYVLKKDKVPEIVLNEEHTEYAWVNRKDIFLYDLIDGEAYCLDIFFKKHYST